MLKGSIVALVTPFKNGKFDERAYRKLVEWHIGEGTHGIVPCGTTGESSTLDYDEHIRVIEVAVKAAKGRIPVIAGTGANATDETILLTQQARDVGADAALLVCPYYNKPSQEGLVRHYRAVAEAVKDFPMVLYNVPGRTALNMSVETVAKLSRVKNIVGIKEASGSMRQVSDMLRASSRNFRMVSGDDFTTFTLMSLGGHGVISVVANVMPRAVAMMVEAMWAGNVGEARKIHFALEELNGAMFYETNPVPVKTGLAMMKMIEEEFRLPLCSMSRENKKRLREVLKKYKLV